MQLAMVNPANRDAHAAPGCTGLCKGEVMGIRWYAAAHEARLPQHESPVILIAQANRFSQSADGVAARLLFGGPHRCFLAGIRVRRAVAISFRPRLLRTISNPLDSGALEVASLTPSGRSLNPHRSQQYGCCRTKPIFSRYFSALVNRGK